VGVRGRLSGARRAILARWWDGQPPYVAWHVETEGVFEVTSGVESEDCVLTGQSLGVVAVQRL
jgi:hypothetical protein